MIDGELISISDLSALRERELGKTIVLATGCFDILHVGHLYFLKAASMQGDILVVGINSDRSLKLIKGPDRPIFVENERAEMIKSFRFVDYVFIYNETVADDYIARLKPDVFAIGEQSVIAYPSEPAIARQVGARVHIITRIPSPSTTSVVKNMQKKLEDQVS